MIRLIHATGTLEFDRFPDLHKPLSTDSHFRFSNAITSFQSHQKAQSFFSPCSDLFRTAGSGEKRREES